MRDFARLAGLEAALLLGLAGCGDDDGTPETDAGVGVDDGGTTPMDGGIVVDAGVPGDAASEDGFGFADAGEATVTLTGWLFGADATERERDASVTGFDGGLPDGAAATPGGRLYGANVVLRDLHTGAELARGRSDVRGFYSLRAPSGALAFLEIEPVGPYLGIIRAEQVSMIDYEAYDIYVPLRSGAEATGTAIGVTYDPTRGVVACGFNPVTPDLGGEGVSLGEGPAHAPPANLTPGGAIVTNVLPARCSALDGSAATPDGGVPCTTLERSDQIHFLNTDLGFVTVTPISPPGGTCAVRFGPPSWLVRPDTYTIVHVDCM